MINKYGQILFANNNSFNITSIKTLPAIKFVNTFPLECIVLQRMDAPKKVWQFVEVSGIGQCY